MSLPPASTFAPPASAYAEKLPIKVSAGRLGPLENIKTGGEDPSRLSGAIAYVKTCRSSSPLAV